MCTRLSRCVWVFVLSGLGALTMVQAAVPVAAHAPAVTTNASLRHPSPPRTSAPELGTRVGNAELAALNGGADTYDQITLNGNVSDTTTTDVSTGVNEIGGGAFANAVGFPMVIQNSGNSVLIQNATIVNVQMKP